MAESRLSYLFNRCLQQQDSDEERTELQVLLQDSVNQELVNELFSEALKAGNARISVSADKRDQILESILKAGKKDKSVSAPVRRIHFLRRWAGAAAAILIMAGIGSYFLLYHSPAQGITASLPQVQRFKNDVAAPAGTKTVLTLASGKQIMLDSAANGELAKLGNVNVTKVDSGQLAYTALNEKPTEITFNTLSTAKGGQTSVVLADGTKVWLNAVSSLRFPTAFTGKERNVEITGEAYFEVSHDPAKPFIVTVNGTLVEVLGTHFNINAYPEETNRKITLLEGAVKVISGTLTTELSPGQQAQIDKTGRITTIDHADLDASVAWKNGYFLLHSEDAEALLREAARWYNVDVEYQRKVDTRFNGEVPRNTPLSDLLKAMELSGGVKFGIEGKKIVVLR